MKSEDLLDILEILEEAPATTEKIYHDLAKLNKKTSKRTIQRSLEELLHINAIGDFHTRPPVYKILINDSYLKNVMFLFARFSQETSGNEIHGSVDPQIQWEALGHLKQPVGFLMTLWRCCRQSREIEFHYQPQTRETLERSFAKLVSGSYNVRHLPRYLVFRVNHGLVLGETIEGDSSSIRQYEIKGISNLRTGQCILRSLHINADEIYADSLRVWTGGKVYDVEIAEYDPLLKNIIKKHKRRVNGEPEILSELASSMGRLRLVNPPLEIVRYAEKFDLDTEKLFVSE